jgi:ribulose-phosphate 3-epimerase
MDGHFVPNITMGPFIVETCARITRLPLDVHLMIEKPERHIQAFADAGASHISVHVEEAPNLHRTLQELRLLGVHPGVVINPGTPAAAIESVVTWWIWFLVSDGHRGFSGQSFLQGMKGKVAAVRDLFKSKKPSALIQVAAE